MLLSLYLKNQSHPQALLTGIERKITYISLVGILRLCQNFSMSIPITHFLFPPGEKFSRLYAFFQSCKARLSVDSFLFIFPMVMLNAQVCEVSSNSMDSDKHSAHLSSYL